MKKLFLLMIVLWQISVGMAYATPASLISYAARFTPFIIIALLIIGLIVWLIMRKKSSSEENKDSA